MIRMREGGRGLEQHHAIGTSFNSRGCVASRTLDVNVEENISIDQMINVETRLASSSLGSVLLGLHRHGNLSSNRPLVHCTSTVEGSTLALPFPTPSIMEGKSDECGPSVNGVVLGAAPTISRG